MPDDSTDISFPALLKMYASRHKCLEKNCLAYFSVWFNIFTKKCRNSVEAEWDSEGGNEDEFQPVLGRNGTTEWYTVESLWGTID